MTDFAYSRTHQAPQMTSLRALLAELQRPRLADATCASGGVPIGGLLAIDHKQLADYLYVVLQDVDGAVWKEQLGRLEEAL